MEKNFLILICFFTSVIGLILIYIATINIEPKQIDLKDLNHELVGRSVTTTGKIVYKKSHEAGHLFLTVSENKTKIQIPLFSGFMSILNEHGLTENDFSIGSEILVSGLVDEYQGQLQIIPRRENDIEILSE
jgi:DNA/RNA endonuclease YhcR with UshA esterase domain